MRNVQKTVREETRTTRGYTYDPSEGLPSDYPFGNNNNNHNQGITNGGTNSTTSTTRTSTTRTNTNTNSNNHNNNNTVSTFPSISDQPFDFDNFDLNNSQSNTTTTTSIQSTLYPGISDSDPGKFSVNVQLSDSIGPEDLKVSIKDHVMTIEAKKEQKSPDGTSSVYQEFSRKFTLPPNVDMRAVRTMLSPQGDLKIEAPLAPPAMKALPAPKSHRNSVTFKRDRDVPIKIGFL